MSIETERGQTMARLSRPAIPMAVATALMACGAPAVHAMQFDTGNPDLAIRWDNTLRYNLGVRVEDQGKIGNNPVYDEGDYRFDQGDVVTNRLDVLSEFDLVFKKSYGFRVSAAGWYDFAYDDAEAKRNPKLPAAVLGSYENDKYSSYTKRYYTGPSGEFLDAFAFAKFYLGDRPLSLKAGSHTVFWGESLLLGGALHAVSYSQAPIDLGKGFATPGSEAKELFRPLTQVSAQFQATSTLSLAAQYFFEWESYRYPEGGTYLGPADFAFYGPDRLQTAVGVLPNAGVGEEPSDTGEWSLSARWSPQWLDGTLGFYYRNYTDKLLGLFVTGGGTPSATDPLGLRYGQFYGENVDLFGVSLGKQVLGVSVGMDLSYRHNTPLTAQTAGYTPSILVGPLAAFGPFLFPHGADSVTLNDGTYQARGNTYHAVLNGLGLVGKTPVFDTASYIVELSYSQLDKVTDNQDMYYGEGYGVCRKELLSVPSPQVQGLYRDKWDGCSTDNHFGVAVNFTPTWFQVFPGVDLSAPLSWSQTLSGNSPVQLGGNEGNGNYAIGLAADVYSKYRFELRYIDFYGKTKENTNAFGLRQVYSQNGLSTLLEDRGFVNLTFKMTF